MTCEYVFRDVTGIYTRLFSHRAAIQGLASNFVKEFEERRGENDHLSMSRTLELVTDCRDRAYPDTIEVMEVNLDEVLNSIKTTSQMCERILQDEVEKKTDWLESQRVRRKQELDEYKTGSENRKVSIDKAFDNTVKQLERHYTELEDKLKEGTKRVL